MTKLKHPLPHRRHSQRKITGRSFTIPELCEATRQKVDREFQLDRSSALRMEAATAVVQQAVEQQQSIYGVTTGFGALSGVAVSGAMASKSQHNLLAFLATGAGSPLAARHVRAAMLLRANVLARGHSGIRPVLVERLLALLNANAVPVVRELGSIGASGDLVPLAVIARAVCGHPRPVEVQWGSRLVDSRTALAELGFEPVELLPKEGLALVNGSSFSAAIAAHAVYESRLLLSLAMASQAMLLISLSSQTDPFDEFVHQQKPHRGQVWTAAIMRSLLAEHEPSGNGRAHNVQDRYAQRCLPQYMGPLVEGIGRVAEVVETEMNAVSDNPLVDVDRGRLVQSGNFLGQYVGIAMDDLRRYLGLLAKHLDVQIASLTAPEFNQGLPPSLRGNDAVPYNMGLKGLQITGNSIMPMLTYYGHPIVEHSPTHAEQFNQNINGLSWGSANLAWQCVELFRHYLSVALIFAVQGLDLRAYASSGHYDGRCLVNGRLAATYEAICAAIGKAPSDSKPLVFNDQDQSLEQWLESIALDIAEHGAIVQSVASILDSFAASFSPPSQPE